MERTIRVTGKGKVSLKPDTIRLWIELTDLDKEYDSTIRKSTEHSGRRNEEIFRMLPGNIVDKSALCETIIASGCKNCIIIGDKGQGMPFVFLHSACG